ncbi:MAG: hypothetical protein HUJ91_01370 [Bacteroidales bacterium]|nr:hypothetical protein [Bacteroidales bacterium]
MELHILYSDRKKLSCSAAKVFFPGAAGAFEVLDGHGAMITPLVAGTIRFESDGQEHSVNISRGFVKIENNVVKATVEALADK